MFANCGIPYSGGAPTGAAAAICAAWNGIYPVWMSGVGAVRRNAPECEERSFHLHPLHPN